MWVTVNQFIGWQEKLENCVCGFILQTFSHGCVLPTVIWTSFSPWTKTGFIYLTLVIWWLSWMFQINLFMWKRFRLKSSCAFWVSLTPNSSSFFLSFCFVPGGSGKRRRKRTDRACWPSWLHWPHCCEITRVSQSLISVFAFARMMVVEDAQLCQSHPLPVTLTRRSFNLCWSIIALYIELCVFKLNVLAETCNICGVATPL